MIRPRARPAARLFSALVLTAAIALFAFVPAAATESAAQQRDADLEVSAQAFEGHTLASISIDLRGPAARIEISVPRGYSLVLDQPVGTQVGAALAVGSDLAAAASPDFLQGDVVVADPAKYATDAIAQACAPGTHAAVWRVGLSVLGSTVDLPIFVDALSGTTEASYVLRACPIWEATASLPKGLSALSISLLVADVVTPPSAAGSYTWSALVTPTLRAASTADPTGAYEVRGIVPYPHVFTLHARYDAKTKTAVLSGKLEAVGRPEAGVEVAFASTTDAADVDASFFGPVTTNASGAFSIRRHIERSTVFSASAESEARPCTAPSTAPKGCISETVSQPPSPNALVIVRRATDPKLRARSRDQALARRATLKVGDFPAGWSSLETLPILPCDEFRPSLRDLTVNGEVASTVFLSDDFSGLAISRSSVYENVAEARAAFRREAQLGAAKCFANEFRRAGDTVYQVGSVPFGRLGDETRAFRVVSSDLQGVDYFDLVSFRRGRVVVHAAFDALAGPLSIERSLAAKVAARSR